MSNKLTIKNACSYPDVVDGEYWKGFNVYSAIEVDEYYEYRIRLGNEVQSRVSIRLWRNPNPNGAYPITGENLIDGKQSKIYKPNKGMLRDVEWIVYYINEIVKEIGF